MRSGTAPCGLRYAVQRSGHAVACCALSIGCGTRDEKGFPAGTAHFTEHTIFRGTRYKSASVISSYLDKLGGELNAYTTKEEIVIHATVLKEDLGKAARLLFELAAFPSFPEDEIETERGVVLDEIIQYKDNPAEDIYDRFEELLFKGTPLETPILGTSASVKRIKADMLHRFVGERFIPSRMAFTVVADMDEARLEKLVLSIADSFFHGIDAAVDTPCTRELLPQANVFKLTVNKRNHEANAVIGGYAPSLYQMPQRIEAALLLNILGGPASNSLLVSQLREKRGWVYGIECSYTQYADSGVFAISFGCDKQNLERCLEAVHRILDKLASSPIGEARLKAFKKQLLGQLAISGESSEARCLSMGKSLLAWNSVMTPGQTRELIDAVTPARLQSLAATLFSPSNLSTLVYL